MRGALLVEPATSADLAAIRELDLGPSVARTIDDEVRSPDRTCLVARLDGEVVGVAVGLLAVDEGHVVDLAVAGTVRRQGIGARLLAELEDRLLAAGATAVTCRTSDEGLWSGELQDDLLPAPPSRPG